MKLTQVGSPAVRLRLARCMAWVKRWSEAMDFLLTIFKTNIFLLRILENRISRKLIQSIYGGSRQKWGKKTEIHANQTNLLMGVADKSEAKKPEIHAN